MIKDSQFPDSKDLKDNNFLEAFENNQVPEDDESRSKYDVFKFHEPTEDQEKETFRLSDGSREIFLSSTKLNLKEMKSLALDILKEKEFRELLNLDNNKSSRNYLG